MYIKNIFIHNKLISLKLKVQSQANNFHLITTQVKNYLNLKSKLIEKSQDFIYSIGNFLTIQSIQIFV